VAVTYGADGAALFRGGKELARAAPPRVRAVDTTGAGDAFVGALTVALLEAQPPERALAFALRCGSHAASRAGAQPSLPTRAEVEALLAT
jgi:ribokinase